MRLERLTKKELIEEVERLRKRVEELDRQAGSQEPEPRDKGMERVFRILDALPVFAYLQAPDYSIRYANPVFVEEYGEPGGRPCHKAIWGRDEPCAECRTFRVFETGAPEVWESVHPDGRAYKVYDYPFADADGSPLVLEISIDETGVRRMEEACDSSETRYRKVHETSLDGIIIADSRGRIVECNPSASRIFGYPVGDLVGMELTSLMPEEFRAAHTDGFRRFLETGRGRIHDRVAEFRALRKDGTTFPNELVVSSFSMGGETFFIGTVRDITERRQAKESLSDQLAFFQLLIDTIPNPVFYKDREGRYLGCNRAFEEALGLSMKELVGRTVFDIAPRELAEVYQRMDALLFDSSGVQVYESKVKYSDGSVHDIIFNKATFSMKGSVAGLVGVMLDITERKQAEDETRLLQDRIMQSQKLEAVGTLAGGIAHDFNNIMTVIKNLSSLAMMKFDDPVLVGDYLTPIWDISERAVGLVHELLVFSNLRALETAEVDLNDTVKNMLGLLARLISEDISVTTELDPGLRDVTADRSRIEQVITNLVINSSEAMPEGGSITIRTANFDGQGRGREGRYVRMTVEDTGAGMDERVREHMFEPFFTTKKTNGTGMGLAVVYGIVSEHGGWLEVESEPGQGAALSVYLPAAPVSDGARPGMGGRRGRMRGDGRRVLLVEDDKWVRKSTAMVLADNGYEVVEAANAENAIAIFYREKGRFDLVLSDVVMPGRNALQMISPLLDINPEVPVLLASSHIDSKSQLDQIVKRGLAFIQKPYEIEDLLSAVDEAITEKKGRA